jgi:hypothetical protein
VPVGKWRNFSVETYSDWQGQGCGSKKCNCHPFHSPRMNRADEMLGSSSTLLSPHFYVLELVSIWLLLQFKGQQKARGYCNLEGSWQTVDFLFLQFVFRFHVVLHSDKGEDPQMTMVRLFATVIKWFILQITSTSIIPHRSWSWLVDCNSYWDGTRCMFI